MLTGRVFVTGGSGFLARAIYAARTHRDVQFTCFSRDDGKHAALQRRFPLVRCIRGDVARTDARPALAAAMRGHDLVIHAAAAKYVDLSETNVFDTIAVNVDGSRNVIMAALEAKVPRVITISTDKACEPVNVYGCSKLAMERMTVEAARWGTETQFTCVRYGNVVGSSGSVIPVFKDQLARFGKVRVTDPAMSRFWMSWNEAILAIERAIELRSGETYIPACRAMTLGDVLFNAVGLRSDQMEIVGLRPGEKMHESLLGPTEVPRADCSLGMRGGWILHGPGEQAKSGHRALFPYRSDNPDEWMLEDEMRRLSDESEAV